MNIAITIAMSLSTAYGIYLFFRLRSWFFLSMTIGGISKQDLNLLNAHLLMDLYLVESRGYIARSISAQNLSDKYMFLIQCLTIM